MTVNEQGFSQNHDNPTDRELVAAARAGDRQAFGQLVERYWSMARHIAVRMVGSQDIAQDLAQEAMLQAYLSLNNLREADRFQSWLYGIVLNVCRDYLRNRKTDFLSLEALAGGLQFDALPFTGGEPGPHEIAETRELHALVLNAVHSLSPGNRAATLLFYYKELSLREVAALLGISVTAVKGRLYRSRQQLREQLLSVYSPSGLTVPTERGRTMVKVTVADVVRQQKADHRVVVLLDEVGHRILPIWIGPYEADAIALHLLDRPTARPLTYNFMASLLEAAGARLEEVRVQALKDETFYGVAKLRSGDTVREVDARPSDAIALALRTDSPIYVAEEVMQETGISVPEQYRGKPLRRGLDQMVQDWEKKEQERKEKGEETEEPCAPEEQREKARQELIAFVFGGETC